MGYTQPKPIQPNRRMKATQLKNLKKILYGTQPSRIPKKQYKAGKPKS